MKFNFKKIASVLTSTVMLSSTVAFAAAANFPEPFVKDGAGSYAIVVGTGASDATAAQNINAYLSDMVTDTTDDTPITIEGDSFLLEKSNNKFNLGDALNSTHLTLDDDELSTMLAEGVYEDEAGDEYDFTQSIGLNGTGITLAHIADSDINENEEPVIGFDIASGTPIFTYSLDFTDNVANNTVTMGETDLTFLGKTYYVSSVTSSGQVITMTLLDSANSATVFSNEPVTVTVGDQTYDVEIVSVSEGNTNKATLKVNGEQIASTNEGSSRKIGDDIYLSILEVSEASRESDNHYVEFSIGNGQIVLQDGSQVEINDETVDGLTVDFVLSSGELTEMKLLWETEDQTFLVPGDELVMPGFESVKLIVGDFVAEYDETVKFKYSSDNYIYVEAPVTDGDVTIPLLNFNGDSTINNLGSDSDEVLVTARGTNPVLSINEDNSTIFVATSINSDEAESYVFQVTSINEVDSGIENEITIKNLASGESTSLSFANASTEDVDFGEINLEFSNLNGDSGNGTVTITGTGNVYADRIVTAEGLTISLPTLGNSTLPTMQGNASATSVNATSTTWITTLTEENYDTDAISGGDAFNVTLGYASGDGPEVTTVSTISREPINEDSEDEEGYLVSELATKILYRTGDDQKTLDVMYNGKEAYAQVYVAEGAATSSSGGSSG